MTFVIMGLGNPNEEYEGTRHNVGRHSVELFAKKKDLSDWKEDKKSKSILSKGKVGSTAVICLLPNTYMNHSGKSAKYYIKSKKAAEKLVVVHDDLDLPIGKMKISFKRGSGGHKGVDSIVKHLKTKAFIRIRVGISASTPKGVAKKVHGEVAVHDYVLGKFKKAEIQKMKIVYTHIENALKTILDRGMEQAMGEFNK